MPKVPIKTRFTGARRLAQGEGKVAGVSDGAVLHAELVVASHREVAEKMVMVLLPDTSKRYLTADLLARERPV